MFSFISYRAHAVAVSLLAVLQAGCGGGGGGSTATMPILPSQPTVVNTTVSWGTDNRTRTTTTSFSDGTSKVEVVDVPPVRSGADLQQASGANSTTPLIDTFGNGVVKVIQDGSSSSPFEQTLLGQKNNADPNAIVKSSTQTWNLRWGTRAEPFNLSTTDDVTARMVSTSRFVSVSGLWGTQSITIPNTFDDTTKLGKSSAAMQESWITPDVKAAWSKGWTGKGVKIGIIDDFTVNDRSDFIRVPFASECKTESGGYRFCPTSSALLVSLTHGEQVSLIAGGSKATFTGIVGETGVYTAPLDFGTYVDASNFGFTLSTPLFGVAKDASIFRNDFLTYQSSTNGLFSEFKRWGDATDATGNLYREIKVFNLSLGYASGDSQQNVARYQSQLAFANSSKVPDAVFVKAAGNSGCNVSSTNCDPLNAVLFNSPNFKEKSILVGALTQSGGTIASYSNKAGNYADRFVVADGRGVLQVDGKYLEGTSFAAPRVSGYLGILRQKFPNLVAEQAAAIILDTAQWNTAWGAKDQSTQAVYGRGEANLGRALAPVGVLR
ncbi:MAG: hypothetical protein RI988_2446 [Pseudomonadota bacterium]|jgi:hypothetical protein